MRREEKEREWARRAIGARGVLPPIVGLPAVGSRDPSPPTVPADDGYGDGGGNGHGGGGGGGGGGGASIVRHVSVSPRVAAGARPTAIAEAVAPTPRPGAVMGGAGGGARWVCIKIPPGVRAGESLLMESPYGRFAVLVPSGTAAGEPLLVPLPRETINPAEASPSRSASSAPDLLAAAAAQGGGGGGGMAAAAMDNNTDGVGAELEAAAAVEAAAEASAQLGVLLAESTPEAEAIAEAEREAQREAQLAALLARGFDAHEAAPYCDGVTAAEDLARLMASDAAALDAAAAGDEVDGVAAEAGGAADGMLFDVGSDGLAAEVAAADSAPPAAEAAPAKAGRSSVCVVS